jgi:phospholipid/cholesterol/gamma-HCH transport system substrate-binding protein
MNNKVNYTLIGVIVLFSLILIMGFIYWMLKPTQDDQVKKYFIYFNESVLGLNIDAPVKYRGISVGKVTKLRINPNNSEQVEVTVTILSSTPIKVDTVAKLTAQGITGLSYINLSMGGHKSPILTKTDEKYPVISTVPSFFEDLEKSFGSVSTKLSTTLTKTEELLSDKNQEQITLLLVSTANFMQRLEKLLDDKTIKSMQNTVYNLESSTNKFDKILPKIDSFIDKSVEWEHNISNSFESIMTSYIGIKGSMLEIKRAVSSGEFNVKAIANDVVPNINNTLIEMQSLMIKLGDTLHQYERSPGDILFKQEEPNIGPGEID